MANFDTEDFINFKTNYTLHNGELIDENALSLAPLRLKKELNNIYNIQRINNGFDPLLWKNVETYLPGEIVTDTIDGLWYRSLMVTFNNQPSTSPTQWEHITYNDISIYGSLDNYLAKNNTNVYVPTGDYNPATKLYVDNLVYSLSGPDGYSTNAAGDYPTDFKSTGEVKNGSGFYITDISNGNVVGTKIVNSGDLLIALTDNPGNTDSKWVIVESNRDQATETIKGVARLATQAEVDAGTLDDVFITPKKLSSSSNINPEAVQDIVGDMVSSNTEQGLSVNYDDVNGNLDLVVNTVDNLVSNSTVNPLSANQGRILKDDIIAMAIALG